MIIFKLFLCLLQVQNAFGLFGIDFLIKSASGKILTVDLFDKLNNETVIIQKNNNDSFENIDLQKNIPLITP